MVKKEPGHKIICLNRKASFNFFFQEILEAGIVVKIVMLILFIASILSWIIIVERYNFFRKVKSANDEFLRIFWSGKDLDALYNEVLKDDNLYGARNLFKNSFNEFNSIKVGDRILN